MCTTLSTLILEFVQPSIQWAQRTPSQPHIAIAVWGSVTFSLLPPLTVRGVIPQLPEIFVFLCDEQLKHCHLYVAEGE